MSTKKTPYCPMFGFCLNDVTYKIQEDICRFSELKADERQFRKELLDALAEEVKGTKLNGQKYRAEWTQDLRKRFL